MTKLGTMGNLVATLNARGESPNVKLFHSLGPDEPQQEVAWLAELRKKLRKIEFYREGFARGM